MYCALPPVDMTNVNCGRGFGVGWNRVCGAMRSDAARAAAGCHQDQLHGGQDFMVAANTPVVSIIPGTVVKVGLEGTPHFPATGLWGYGNCVVVEHRFTLPPPTTPLPGQSAPPRTGMPNPFWVLYAHFRAPPLVHVGQHVDAGTLLGYSGNTNNGSFPGMPAHLHVEVRGRAYPSSYDNDTINPDLLFNSLGIDRTGASLQAGRYTGGKLLVRAGGPSDCRTGQHTSLSGFERAFRAYAGFGVVYGPTQSGQASPGEQYIPPSVLSPNYPGTTTPGPDVTDASSPDYGSSGGGAAGGGSGSGMVVGGIAAAVLLALWLRSR